MSSVQTPVSDMLITVKSREVQRGMLAEMSERKTKALQRFLAAAPRRIPAGSTPTSTIISTRLGRSERPARPIPSRPRPRPGSPSTARLEPRCIDAAILRDENTGANGLCDDQRLYYLNDANFNVTTLLDTAGDPVERYLYSPYGVVTIYDATWTSTRSTSSYGNVTLYTGRELDGETGLYYYRNRYYSAELGRFVRRAPIRYMGGSLNFLEYVQSCPTSFLDCFGLQTAAPLPGRHSQARICCRFFRSCCEYDETGKMKPLPREEKWIDLRVALPPRGGVNLGQQCNTWLGNKRASLPAPKKGCGPWQFGSVTATPCGLADGHSCCDVELVPPRGGRPWGYKPIPPAGSHVIPEGSRQMARFYNHLTGYTGFDYVGCVDSCMAVMGSCIPTIVGLTTAPLPGGSSPGLMCGPFCTGATAAQALPF